jgi:hypothetical protein
MENINKNFDIPYYIFEEITEYIELTAMGNCKTMKWENITSLLNLAVINNRLTEQQAIYLKQTFCREEKKM